MKLVQILALALQIPRRKTIDLIIDKKVKVNNIITEQFSLSIDAKDLIEVETEHEKLQFKAADFLNLEKNYLAFYKPKGIITSIQGLKYYLAKINIPNLKPVGRLDQESEGLLLLTDDGDFILKLTHPQFHVPKKYLIWIEGLKDEKQLDFLHNSLDFQVKSENMLEIELKEGKNRQIRRACSQAGLFVKRILRISVGKVQLNNLKVGEWIKINPKGLLI